jgi:hypothetical protein
MKLVSHLSGDAITNGIYLNLLVFLVTFVDSCGFMGYGFGSKNVAFSHFISTDPLWSTHGSI